MDRATTNEYTPTDVSPPGETLRDLLTERGLTQAQLATRMGRPQKTISEIMNGKATITAQTALELELVLGVAADFWIARERNYRTNLARREQADRLSKDIEWARNFPLGEMSRRGWITDTSEPADCVRSLLEFFGVASRDQWTSVYASYRAALRKSAAFSASDYALSAWLRGGMRDAELVNTEQYDRDVFIAALASSRSLTAEPPESFQQTLTDRCAGAGVVVLFVPELPKSRVSGATMWLTPERALVQLSLRYKTDDQLWFTFFHEAAHVLLHRKKQIYIEVEGLSGEEETEANKWAADFLIPPREYQILKSYKKHSKAFIRDFASRLGISAGIVVGRLQHEGILPHDHCNDLKQGFEWSTGG